MSRSGYTDDGEYVELWRGAVDRALGGKRGQAFLRELVAALDTLPQKRLVSDELERDGEYCALGAVACARGIPTDGVDTEDRDDLSDKFGIAPAMAAEIMWINDERRVWLHSERRWQDATPELRFAAVREWAVEHIQLTPEEIGAAEASL